MSRSSWDSLWRYWNKSPLCSQRVFLFRVQSQRLSDQYFWYDISYFWTLISVITVKYISIVLRADNNGEGGVLALLSLLKNQKNGQSKKYFTFLTIIGIFGASLLYGDSIITPAISVLSALEGVRVATKTLDAFIIPITVLILFILFYFQHKGTSRIGRFFGPIMLLWYVSLALLGIYGIFENPEILRAMSPHYAILFLFEHGFKSLFILGAVFLVITGGEALYADLGHFGRKSIQSVWFSVALPALTLNYFGQGALILKFPATIENPFYHLVPSFLLYPMVILATFATVIASQAVISGVFSLTNQAVNLGYLPRLKIVHTSSKEIGQIYIPFLNWLLFILIVFLVVNFKTSGNLAGAYGLSVSMTMFITTLLIFFVSVKLWKFSYYLAIPIFLVFFTIDLTFLTGNFIKILNGGWVPLVFGVFVLTLMTTWRKGRRLLFDRLYENLWPLELALQKMKDTELTKIHGTAVFMTGSQNRVPPTFALNMKHNKIFHEHIIFLHVAITNTPYLTGQERIECKKINSGVYYVTAFYGFMQNPNVINDLELSTTLLDFKLNLDEITYFVGRETLLSTEGSTMSPWRGKLFAFMSRNARQPTHYFSIPSEKVIEIGAQVNLGIAKPE